LIYGYSLSFDETAGTPLTTFFGFIPLVPIVAYMLVRRKPFNPDTLFRCALLLVIAGLMMVPAATSLDEGAINNILAAGVTLAELTLWFVLLALASRNWLGAVSVIAWGTSLSFIGIDIGAALGRLTNISALNEPIVTTGITVAITLMMLTYTLFFLKDFNFSTTIGGVQPDKEIVVGTVPTSELNERSSALATHYHLTQRESEVLTLLARGRSINYIRDELVVSRNTVKAHVKHIYLKLDVHTQQQIIDLFEMN
jgi:DNA-binding CsgD family transcriptional regulator